MKLMRLRKREAKEVEKCNGVEASGDRYHDGSV
jgi:hypothetical protein